MLATASDSAETRLWETNPAMCPDPGEVTPIADSDPNLTTGTKE